LRFSNLKRLNLINVKKERHESGIYKIYNRRKNLIYVGTSTKLKHRLEAHLYGRSDYRQVAGKMELLKQSYYYATAYTDIHTARRTERNIKQYCKFNKC